MNYIASYITNKPETASKQLQAPILQLPNELLLQTLALLPTRSLAPLTLVCRRFAALTLRLWHLRLYSLVSSISAKFDNEKVYTILLECYHPSEKLTAPPLDCVFTSAPGLGDCLDDNPVSSNLSNMRNVYCRFSPQRHGARERRGVPGDIPGTRTYPSSLDDTFNDWHPQREPDPPKQNVTLESHELFTQLVAHVNLVRTGPREGIYLAFVQIQDNVVRVWKDWLSSRAGPDSVAQRRRNMSLSVEEQAMVDMSMPHKNEDKATVPPAKEMPLKEDPRMIWLDNNKNLGIRVRVKKTQHRHTAPVLMAATDPQDVTCEFEILYEELFVRAMHLLHTLEEHASDHSKDSGKAVVFHQFRS